MIVTRTNFLRTARNVSMLLTMIFIYACGSDEEPQADCSSSNLQASTNNITNATCNQDNGRSPEPTGRK